MGMLQLIENINTRYLDERGGKAAASNHPPGRKQRSRHTPPTLNITGCLVGVNAEPGKFPRKLLCPCPYRQVIMLKHVEKGLEVEEGCGRNVLVANSLFGPQALGPHSVGGSLSTSRSKDTTRILCLPLGRDIFARPGP